MSANMDQRSLHLDLDLYLDRRDHEEVLPPADTLIIQSGHVAGADPCCVCVAFDLRRLYM